MVLILTEKREVATDMAATLEDATLGTDAKALGDLGKRQGYIEGDKYILTWAAGHLFSLKTARELDSSYGLYQLLENHDDYKMTKMREQIAYVPTEDDYKERQREIIKKQLNRSDITKIIIATDADAEGEAIGRDMIFRIKPNINTTIERLWNTGSFKAKESVQKAMNNLLPYDDIKYQRLYDSQQARSIADYITGMKLTKTLTDNYNKPFYTGRVKAVVIALIGNRELEIKDFKPKDYWQVKALKDDLELSNFYYEDIDDIDKNGEPITKTIKQRNYYKKEDADKVIDDLSNKSCTVEKMHSSITTSKSRPLPLSGTDFASEMMGKYKIKYEQCNQILDYLREEGFTTYPGTNGRYFANTDKEEVQQALTTATKYFNLADTNFTTDTYLFNDKKAAKQNHTPLSITTKIPTQADIETWEAHKLPNVKNAYELIAKRIAVAFLDNDEIEKQELIISSVTGAHHFDLTGQKALKQGWRTFIDMEVKDTTFKSDTELKEGDLIEINSTELKTSKTKCPKQYTTKLLLDTLMNVSRVVDKLISESDDPDYIVKMKSIKKQLKSAEGIGTDRTREQIIKTLVENEIIKQSGKDEQMNLTTNGWELYKVLPTKLKSVALTARWENIFEDIRNGDIDLETALSEIDNNIMEDMIPQIFNDLGKNVEVNERKQSINETIKGIKCPLCDSEIVETDHTYKCSKHIWDVEAKKNKGCKFSIFKNQDKTLGRALAGKNDLDLILAATKDNPLKENKHSIYFDPENKYLISTIWDNSNSQSGDLVETPKTFRKGDKFVFKNVNWKNITKAQAEKLLDGKSVTLTRKTKGGKPYKIKCTLKDNGAVDTETVN